MIGSERTQRRTKGGVRSEAAGGGGGGGRSYRPTPLHSSHLNPPIATPPAVVPAAPSLTFSSPPRLARRGSAVHIESSVECQVES